MRKSIYGISVLVMFMALVMGVDNWFGPDVKHFCRIIFFIWMAEVLTGNWEKIKELFKAMYGLE